MRPYIVIALLTTGLLAGCAPTEKQFDSDLSVLRGSERARNDLLDYCIRNLSLSDQKARHNAAIAMSVSERDAPKTVCGRYTKALVAGRITYQDLLDIRNNRHTPKLDKIFLGG